MAPLDGAIALEQMHGIAVGIGEDLHLDMARAGHEALDQHAVVAEAAIGLARRAGQRIGELGRRSRPAACPCRRRRPRP
jgi:hypothetical protein